MGDDHRVAARVVQAVVTLVPIGFALYYGNELGLGLVLEVVAVSITAGFAAAFAYLLIRTDRGSSHFIALFAAPALACTGYSAWLITTAREVEQQEANAQDPPQRIHIGSDAAERFGLPVSFVVEVEVRNLDHPPTSADLTGNGSIATPVAAYYQDGVRSTPFCSDRRVQPVSCRSRSRSGRARFVPERRVRSRRPPTSPCASRCRTTVGIHPGQAFRHVPRVVPPHPSEPLTGGQIGLSVGRGLLRHTV